MLRLPGVVASWPLRRVVNTSDAGRYLSTATPKFKVAIVGSGPSGCYTAKYLQAAWKKAGKETPHIDVIERLPTPYGLVR